MNTEALVKDWFAKWQHGDYLHLPLTEDFKHTSPFGITEGKQVYLDLVRQNEDKFLGQTFTLHDGLYHEDRACVRYTARQGDNFLLEVSEWYYFHDQQIKEIVAYYHMGEIREERKLKH